MTSEVNGPTWTILIATIGQREALFRGLLDRLLPQTVPFAGQVEVRAWWNNGDPGLPEIRQGLLDSVTTDYVSFIDDDDMVPTDFVRTVMQALNTRPDYVGWQVRYLNGGQDRGLIDHSLRHGGWREEKNPYRLLRDISHINPMRTEVAKRADFRGVRAGRPEDWPWVDQVRATGLLRTEVYIPRPMYEYRWDKAISAWRRPQRIRKGYRRPVIEHPNFTWHAPRPPGRLAVIVPTRGRPDNIRKVIAAWDETGAWDHADLVLAVDRDDPEYRAYLDLVKPLGQVWSYTVDEWMPMVPKLNLVAAEWARKGDHSAIAFAGDDHLPRTAGWAEAYLTALAEPGVGMVHGDDGYQGKRLSTEWAVTADAVRALGKMVPAPVDHLYCDNAMMDLFGQAGMLRYLPEVRIEHMHPIAGKAASDEQYERVNGREQYANDRRAYQDWKRFTLPAQLGRLLALRRDHRPARTPRVTPKEKRVMRWTGPRKIERSGPRRGLNAPPKSKFPFPASFRSVEGATPDEIGFTLADFAKQVPADQEIVEIGVYQGRTAILMAWGASLGNNAHVTAIDAWDLIGNVYDPPFTLAETRAHAEHNVASTGYQDKVTLINAFSHEIAARWQFPGMPRQPIGLLFVDGDHTREGARRDIEAWAPHLAPGAVIAIDDYGHVDWPGVGQAVDELVDEGFLEPVEVYHDRLAVTRLASKAKITAITSEGVEPAPEPEYLTLDLPKLRRYAQERGVARAGVMGRERLIEAIEAS